MQPLPAPSCLQLSGDFPAARTVPPCRTDRANGPTGSCSPEGLLQVRRGNLGPTNCRKESGPQAQLLCAPGSMRLHVPACWLSVLLPALQQCRVRGHGTTRGTPRLGRRAQHIQRLDTDTSQPAPASGTGFPYNVKSITVSEVLALEKILLERSCRALVRAPGCLNQLPGTVVTTTPGKESIFQCKLQTAERTAAAELSKASPPASPVPGALPQPVQLHTSTCQKHAALLTLHHAQPQPTPQHHHVGPTQMPYTALLGLKPYFCMGRCKKAKSHRMPALPLTVRTACPVCAARHLL